MILPAYSNLFAGYAVFLFRIALFIRLITSTGITHTWKCVNFYLLIVLK